MPFWEKKPKQAEMQVSVTKENEQVDQISRNKFRKVFRQFTYRSRAWDVWKYFIVMCACSI